MKIDYSREELLAICEKAFVSQSDWTDRDSASAQLQLGEAYSLLKAGCDFDIEHDPDSKSGCSTDDKTIWIQFYVHDFIYFECDMSEDKEHRGTCSADYHFYLPTLARLKEVGGKDWY
jgi:hypothetical protein